MTTFGWQHAKVKSTKSNPPSKVAKAKYLYAHQIANDKTIILSTENVQKVHSSPKLWGFEKWCGEIGQNALTVALFKQLPQA